MHSDPRSPSRSALAAALVLSAATTFAVAAQPPAPTAEPTFEEEIEVTEVLLDVLVTDRQGNVIVGLGPDDFEVREDGEEVELASATFYSSSLPTESREELGAKGVAVDRVAEDRFFILFFDDVAKYQSAELNLMRQQIRAARDAASWVREALAPADWVAVVGFDRKLEIHQDFTRDREEILAAIERAGRGAEGIENWPSRRDEEGETPSLTDDLPSGRELLRATPRVYEALQLVAEAAADVRGRKNLVYLGIGFGDIDPYGQYREDQRYYPSMERALNDANVAVYPIDLMPQGVHHPLENALSQVASDTGGRTFPFFTSFGTPLRQISDESAGYYLLAYQARHPRGEAGFQPVEVEATDPQLQVRARSGYLYGGSAESADSSAGGAEDEGR